MGKVKRDAYKQAKVKCVSIPYGKGKGNKPRIESK